MSPFCLMLLAMLFLSGQPNPGQTGFSLKDVKINGLPFFTTQVAMRDKWGKEDSVSNAARHDEMGCYAITKGKGEIQPTWYFFPGLRYVSTSEKNVQFYSLDFTHARMSKAIISLSGINVTAGTTKAQLLKAYPKARIMEVSTGYDFPKGGADIAIDTAGPDTGEALIFEFRDGKLTRVVHWFDCT